MASFLEELPCTENISIQRRKATSRNQAYGNLENSIPDDSEYLLFEIDQETFSRDFLCTNSDISRFWTSYDVSQKLFLIQIGTLEHSQATAFNDSLVAALRAYGSPHGVADVFGGHYHTRQYRKLQAR